MNINWQRSLLKQCLAVSLFTGYIFTFRVSTSVAQITSDSTLGTRVIQQSPSIDRIEGGAVRGASLFHSFQEFNVGEGRRVEFAPLDGIENIFSRVTGDNASNIKGTLGVSGNANLFLLNPNGILFGPNADLDILGSFVASTANSLLFKDGVEFSATNPQGLPILKINLPIGLQFGSNPVGIEMQNVNLLDKQRGVTRALLGGNVTLDGSGLRARGGRVDLGGLAETGTVNLVSKDGNFSFSFPVGVKRSDVLLENGSVVNVRDKEAGDIAINAHNFILKEGSQLKAGIREIGTASSKAGDISVNATGQVTLTDALSFISNSIEASGLGQGGNIDIDAEELSVTGGAQISAATFGKGNAGNINIQAPTISFQGGENLNSEFQPSIALSDVGETGIGKAGNITLKTDTLSVTEGAQLKSSSSGNGDAGNITISANNSISFDGISEIGKTEKSDKYSSGAFSRVENGGEGKSGSISINTENLSIKNGAIFTTSTFGKQGAGNIDIKSKEVTVDGESPAAFSSGIYNRILTEGEGQGGNITIDTDNLSVTNGGRLEASSLGNGDAGSITINADSSIYFDNVSATGKTITEESKQTDKYSSGAFSRVEESGEGKSGSISINTENLFIKNGAVLSTSTFGTQGAGKIDIKSKEVTVDGESPAAFSSGIYSRILKGGAGQGGNITINTDNLSVTNGGRLATRSLGNGDGGNITINARDTVYFDDISPTGKKNNSLLVDRYSSGIFSRVERNENDALDTRKSGYISIKTRKLFITNGAFLTTSTFGMQKAGNIDIKATDEVEIIGTGANTFSSGVYSRGLKDADGSAGDIKIETGKLSVADNALIEATSRLSNSTGGSIEIITHKDLSIRNRAKVSVDSAGTGNAGDIKVNAASVSLIEQGTIDATTESTNGGNISLEVQDVLFMRSDSRISTTAGTANAGGNGGRINISTPIILSIPLENSDISADAFSGQGGEVEITSQKIFWMEPLSRDELLQRLGSDPLTPERLPTNDITAISQQNPSLNGVLAINSLDVDLNRGLTPLPSSLEDPSNRIDTSCSIDNTRDNTNKIPSQFVNTGRGGLPPSPNDPLNDDTVITRLATIDKQSTNRSTRVNLPKQNDSKPKKIVEAQGWTKLPNGRIKFISQSSTVTPQKNWQSSSGCNVH